MQVQPHLQQIPISITQSAPKRSLSYNDLKRKRLLRSEKSKTKLQSQHSEKLIVRTEKKKTSETFDIALSSAPKTSQDIKKIEKSINQLKDVFDEIQEKTKSKKYIISKPFYTDRLRENSQKMNKISFIDRSTTLNNGKMSLFYESIEMAGNEKQLIKKIIEKKKSQKLLLKFNEVRAQVKKSKSNSKLNILQEETAPHSKIISQSPTQEIKQQLKQRKNMRAKKFQIVEERPFLKFNKSNTNSKQRLINNYITQNLSSKQASELGQKIQYRSRRILKIDGFNTQRKDIEVTKKGQMSDSRPKFHRRLKKTNSQIIIKTSDITYNKSKYTSRIESKSVLNIKNSPQKHNNSEEKLLRAQNQQTKHQQCEKTSEKIKESLKKQINEPQFLSKSQFDYKINLLKDLELSSINISEIQIKKEQSFTQIQNDISLINAIEAQQLQLRMKQSHSQVSQKFEEGIKLNSKQSKQFFKKQNKKSVNKMPQEKLQNDENRQNLLNLLDFISLPTEELKIKINNGSTKIAKKKNEMEKFKKIFPVNFFNK